MARLVSFAAASALGFGTTVAATRKPVHDHYEVDLSTHPYVQKLVNQGYTLDHPNRRLPGFHQHEMVTSSVLAGPGRIGAEPVVLRSRDGEQQSVYYLGTGLRAVNQPTRRPWYARALEFAKLRAPQATVHNGLAVTILDVGLARTAFERLPNRVGVTALLNASFYRDIPPDSYVVLKSTPDMNIGRKAGASGSIYLLHGKTLGAEVAQGSVLMVEPSWAKRYAWALQYLVNP